MQITLNHTDILEALSLYVGKQGIDTRGKKLDITLTAGRGANGFKADVDISQIAPSDCTISPEEQDALLDSVENPDECLEPTETPVEVFGAVASEKPLFSTEDD